MSRSRIEHIWNPMDPYGVLRAELDALHARVAELELAARTHCVVHTRCNKKTATCVLEES